MQTLLFRKSSIELIERPSSKLGIRVQERIKTVTAPAGAAAFCRFSQPSI